MNKLDQRVKSLELKMKAKEGFNPVVLFESDFPTPEDCQRKRDELKAQGYFTVLVRFIDTKVEVNDQ